MNDKPSTEKESTPVTGIVVEDIDEIAKYDPELRFRRLSGIALKLMYAMTLVLSLFHIYTAGFGVLQEWRHRAFHLAFVLPLVFFLYTMRKSGTEGEKIPDLRSDLRRHRQLHSDRHGPGTLPPLPGAHRAHRRRLVPPFPLLQAAGISFGQSGRIHRFPHLHGDDPGAGLYLLSRILRSPFPDLVQGPEPHARLLGHLSAGDLSLHSVSLRPPVDQQHPDAFRQPDRPLQPGQYPLF